MAVATVTMYSTSYHSILFLPFARDVLKLIDATALTYITYSYIAREVCHAYFLSFSLHQTVHANTPASCNMIHNLIIRINNYWVLATFVCIVMLHINLMWLFHNYSVV